MSFATAPQITELESVIKSILNATTAGFGGTIDDARRDAALITAARVYGTMEVIKAIAQNTSHGFWGAIAADVAVAHNDFLPEHEGQVGIPLIVPYDGGTARDGYPADPDAIDSFRNDSLGLYTRSFGVAVAHNAADGAGIPSRTAGYYSLINSRFKFSGFSAVIPMIQLTSTVISTKLPYSLAPTVAKLAPLYALKEGDNLIGLAQLLVQAGQADLIAIERGAISVRPVADIMEAQKEI